MLSDRARFALTDTRGRPSAAKRRFALFRADGMVVNDPADDCECARVFWPPITERAMLRLDRGVLAWFPRRGWGYWARIDVVLLAFSKTHQC